MSTTYEQPPRFDELMAGFLAGQFGQPAVADCGSVEAYEAVPAAMVDPRHAWDAATTGVDGRVAGAKMPAGWTGFVAALPPQAGVPMAVGCFPQAVRDPLALADAPALAPVAGGESAVEGVEFNSAVKWYVDAADPGSWLVAVGLRRAARQLDAAAAILAEKCDSIPADWRAAWENERAALAWQRGRRDTAIESWRSRPESAASQFNLGMALLFTDQAASARPFLAAAAKRLDESNPWHHLAQLYLALAESR